MAMTESTATTPRARTAARTMSAVPTEAKDAALEAIAGAIGRRAGEILAANAIDVAAAAGQRAAIVDRLTLDPRRTAALAEAVRAIAGLPDPVGSTIREFTVARGLRATKLRVPLGVVLIVYEARPNVTV